MYDPKGNSREKDLALVRFTETEPPEPLKEIVHRFLEIETERPLENDYRFHALPDACAYLIFDQQRTEVTGVTKLRASSEELNLGRRFHYVNVRILPGVWQRDQIDVSHGMIDTPYGGPLPLVETNRRLIGLNWDEKQAVLVDLVERLMADGLVVANPVTEKIFTNIDDVFSVADMADIAALSPRQLQRVLKSTTGLAPHDFLKVLRLQQSLRGEPSLSYADQSHFIHSFKKATGYTPGKYAKKFDV